MVWKKEFMYAGDLADAIFYGLKDSQILNFKYRLSYDYKIIDISKRR